MLTGFINEILKSYSNEGLGFDFNVFYYNGKDKFLVNNSIFDIVSWNIDEEGYGVTMDDLIHDVVESIMLE